jgi:hypothetical protein
MEIVLIGRTESFLFGGYLPAKQKTFLCALRASVVKNLFWTTLIAAA